MAHAVFKGESKIVAKFWGVRGSFPTGDARIGGHTSCLTLQFPGQLVILDTGSGMIDLGDELISPSFSPGTSVSDVETFVKIWLGQKGNKPEGLGQALGGRFKSANGGVRATVITSHVHGDHLFGIQAFKPVFMPTTNLHFIGATHNGLTIQDVMERFVFAPPVFPVPWGALASTCTHQQIEVGERFEIPTGDGNVKVWMLPMNHPNQAYGFRFEYKGRVIAVTMDHEHGHEFDQNIVKLADGADLWITEAQYTDEQYQRCVGFGHISESAAAKQAREARPKLIYTTHHDPNANFDTVQQIARTIEESAQVDTRFAWQGAEVHV
jgi:phosphoribosyl 1,2-cyclic phosphodiesterase